MSDTESADKAARCIQRAYKAYWLRKTIAYLRDYAPWLFSWTLDPSDNIDFDLIQAHLTDKKLQRLLCQVMEILGCAKTSSLCHCKMILLAHTLVQAPSVILNNLDQQTGDVDFKKQPPAAIPGDYSSSGSGSSSSIGSGETCIDKLSETFGVCEAEDPGTERELSFFEKDLVLRARLLGSNFLLVCRIPEDWTTRLSFAASYSNFCRLFLEWKTKDANEIIKESLHKFSLYLNNYKHLKAGTGALSISPVKYSQLTNTYKSLCEQHYMMILKLVGSSSKCRQLVHRHLLKTAFLKELRLHFGSTKQLVAVEWAEVGDESSTYRLRMAFMSLMVSSSSINDAPSFMKTFISPRLGTRLDDVDPLSSEKWHGEHFTRYKLAENTAWMECLTENPYTNQSLWVPPIAFFIIDTFQRIGNRFLNKECKLIDMEFICEQAEMNQYNFQNFLDWAVDIAARLYHVAYIDKTIRDQDDKVQALRDLFKEKIYKAPRFREAVMFVIRLVEYIRIQHNEQQLIMVLNSIMASTSRCHCGSASFGGNNEECLCKGGGILFDIQDIKYSGVRDMDRQKLLSSMNDATRQLISNELVLFVRDLQSSEKHNIAKLSQWIKPPSSDKTGGASTNGAVAPSSSSSHSTTDPFYPIFENLANFMMTLDMTMLPETFESLRVSVSRAKLLIQDTVRLYVITSLVLALAGGCSKYLDRFSKGLYEILTSEGCDATQHRNILSLIEKECPCIVGKDRDLVYGLVKRLVVDNELDGVAKLALSRIKQGIIHRYISTTSGSDSTQPDGKDTTDWLVETVGPVFKHQLKTIEDLVLDIWEISVVTYGPIYESLISLASKNKLIVSTQAIGASQSHLMKSLAAESTQSKA